MELVHHDLVDRRIDTGAKRHVGHDLGGGADNRRRRVDGGVTRQHADPVRAQIGAQSEEFLRDQSFDRRRVKRAPAGGQGGDVSAEGHQAFAGPGRGIEDHVGSGEHLDKGLLLRRVKRHAPIRRPADETLEGVVDARSCGQEVGEGGHQGSTVPDPGGLS
jgi:hypothetical protein